MAVVLASSTLSAQQMGRCTDGGEPIFYGTVNNPYACEISTPPAQRCVPDTPNQCLPWTNPDSGSRKWWGYNPGVGTCEKAEYQPNSCKICPDSAIYCAAGYKYPTQQDCVDHTNWVPILGWRSGFCM